MFFRIHHLLQLVQIIDSSTDLFTGQQSFEVITRVENKFFHRILPSALHFPKCIVTFKPEPFSASNIKKIDFIYMCCSFKKHGLIKKFIISENTKKNPFQEESTLRNRHNKRLLVHSATQYIIVLYYAIV
jgi:hypothetical protein